MGWWSDTVDTVTGAADDAWDAVSDAAGTVWEYTPLRMGIEWVGDQFEEDMPKYKPPSQYSMDLAASLNPTKDNPYVRKWTDATIAGVKRAGGNSAAAAAAGARAQTGGRQKMARLAPDYWQRMMSLALGLSQDAASIPTTSSGNAFLSGFTSGGGFAGLGGLMGGGSSGGGSQMIDYTGNDASGGYYG